MQKTAKILVSNIGLPTTKIGSWTTRLSQFLENNPEIFDFVLSPNSEGSKLLYCKKRKFFTWKKQLRRFQLLNWVAADYLNQLKKLSKKYSKITILVMDDPHLLEAISFTKSKLKCEVELIFSFHGYELTIHPKIIAEVDKILFLSQTGVEKSELEYQNFPKTIVVGNAVDSNVFYPLENSAFIQERKKMGFTENDEILIWMANDRPKKGFHIFKIVAENLLQNNEDLKVLIIGSIQSIDHKNAKSVGKIPNKDVASLLQLGNYYLFTTLYEEGFGLSMIEALKCGNAVIASSRGAVPEVLNNLEQAYLVDEVEKIDSWIESFNLARTNSNFGKNRPTKHYTDGIWNYRTWETKFLNAIS